MPRSVPVMQRKAITRVVARCADLDQPEYKKWVAAVEAVDVAIRSLGRPPRPHHKDYDSRPLIPKPKGLKLPSGGKLRAVSPATWASLPVEQQYEHARGHYESMLYTLLRVSTLEKLGVNIKPRASPKYLTGRRAETDQYKADALAAVLPMATKALGAVVTNAIAELQRKKLDDAAHYLREHREDYTSALLCRLPRPVRSLPTISPASTNRRVDRVKS